MATDQMTADELLDVLGIPAEQIRQALQQRLTALDEERARVQSALHTVEARLVRTPSPATPAPGFYGGGPVPTFSGSVPKVTAVRPTAQPDIEHQKPLSLMDATERVLLKIGHPLHTKELVRGLQAMGVKADKDYESVRGSIVPTIEKKVRDEQVFTKVGPGTYGLRVWSEQQNHSGNGNGQVPLEGLGR